MADPLRLQLDDVGVVRDGTALLSQVTWTVGHAQRWIVLGANGSGKTTLLRIASLYLHPSTGTVRVLGGELGRVDIRTLRPRIGLASPAFGALLRPELTPVEVVMTARNATLEPWWHTYDGDDRERALGLLDRFHVLHGADRAVSSLSSGERQRVLLARAFSGDPGLVLLDEPTAGLDLAGREEIVAALGTAAGADGPPTVLVTHHVEEIPVGSTHVLLLRAAKVVAAGPIDDILTADALGDTFGLPLELERRADRWTAWSRR